MMKYLLFLLSFIFITNTHSQIITNYTNIDGLIDNFVECIDVDINNNIWFGTSVGLQVYDGVNWNLYDMASYPGMASDNIKVVTAASNGDIWIGTDYGASKFDGINWITYNSTNGLNNNQVYSIDEDLSGNIWIGTHGGVSYYNGSTWNSYGYPELHWSGVNSTAFDENGDPWFACPLGGVIHKDGISFVPYDTSNELLSQNVRDLVIDNQGNKWIGTGSGMSVLNTTNTSFYHYTQMYLMPPPDTLNPVVDIEIDSYGRIWSAIYVGYLAEGGIAYWDGNQWEDFHVSDGLVGPNVRGLAIDSEDNVWLATSTGVSKISSFPSSLNSVYISNFDVFPNPSSGIITVSCDENLKNLEVYNVLGSLIYSQSIDYFNESKLNLSHLNSGIYHLVLRSDKGFLNQKFIIE